MRIAASHPGKIGDFLYILPLARKVSEMYNCQIDIYTSKYCEPTRSLVEYQSYVNKMIVPDNYEVERMDMGCQPWKMPIPEAEYDLIYQCGFQRVPDEALHKFIGHQFDIEVDDPKYDYPEWTPDKKSFLLPPEKYYVLAPRGETTYKDTFTRLINVSKVPIIQIGGRTELLAQHLNTIPYDYTGIPFLETASLIANSAGFIGLMSSMLVLANGFDVPRISPHDNQSWDMRHVIYSPNNYYPVNPTAEEILDILENGDK